MITKSFREALSKIYEKKEECDCDCGKSPCEKCGKDHHEMKEALDPVDKSELKGKHKDRKDKDIDNDGDVDKSDQYLHRRRKAVSKAMDEPEMNQEETELDEVTVNTADIEKKKMISKSDKDKLAAVHAMMQKEKDKMTKEDIELIDESLDKHISDFSKGVKSSKSKSSHSKTTGKPVANMKHVETDAKPDEVFAHLKKMGYKKRKGYDPNPNSFTTSHNADTMTTKSSSVHHPSGVSAHFEKEHGSKMKVHFYKEDIERATDVKRVKRKNPETGEVEWMNVRKAIEVGKGKMESNMTTAELIETAANRPQDKTAGEKNVIKQGSSNIHNCAKKVMHETWGKGECIPTMHADPDSDGNVAWYDVMFEHGLEKKVSIEDLEVIFAESHKHK